MSDYFSFLNVCKEHYRDWNVMAFAEHERTGRMSFNPYALDFMDMLTPIEQSVWADIRCAGLAMYPQYPACGYFLDFANPFKKIAIECDGKDWHENTESKIRDYERDMELACDGWIIYRIKGHECNRITENPIEKYNLYRADGYSEEDAMRLVSQIAFDYYMKTSEGIVNAIANSITGKESIFQRFHYRTLDEHRSIF